MEVLEASPSKPSASSVVLMMMIVGRSCTTYIKSHADETSLDPTSRDAGYVSESTLCSMQDGGRRSGWRKQTRLDTFHRNWRTLFNITRNYAIRTIRLMERLMERWNVCFLLVTMLQCCVLYKIAALLWLMLVTCSDPCVTSTWTFLVSSAAAPENNA